MSVSTSEAERTAATPLLARIWHEDDVWNVSAFDLPIVAYGSTVEEARSNFEEAADAHFRALNDFGLLAEAVRVLKEAAEDRGFWEARVTSREMVQRFDLPSMQSGDVLAVAV